MMMSLISLSDIMNPGSPLFASIYICIRNKRITNMNKSSIHIYIYILCISNIRYIIYRNISNKKAANYNGNTAELLGAGGKDWQKLTNQNFVSRHLGGLN